MASRLGLGRVQSLLGVLPLGSYLVFHLVDQWPALSGREVWVEHAARHPPRMWLLALLVAAAAVHAVLGVARLVQADGERSARRLRGLQALTGLLLLGFVAYHVAQVWAPGVGAHTSPRDAYDCLWRLAGEPLSLSIYLVGITAAWFHFAHGLSRAAFTWGLAVSPRGIMGARVLAGALGFVFWLLSLQLLAHFALGTSLVPW